MPRLPADIRRTQLVEAAMTLAEQRGPGAVTVRPVAELAGVSLGLVHYQFEDKDELLAEMGEALVRQVGEGLAEVFGQAHHLPAERGLKGLHQLLQTGLRGMWPVIASTPRRQLLGYELTTAALRNRGKGNQRAGQIADRQYQTMDTEAVQFLEHCAQTARVQWTAPVSDVARFALAALDGLILRWLVDFDDNATLAAFDDLAQIITSKAIEIPETLDKHPDPR